MAEGEGFEPSIRLPVYTLSRRAPSATRPPLRRRLRRGRLRCEAPKACSAGALLDAARCLRRKSSGPGSVAGRHLASGGQIRKAPGRRPQPRLPLRRLPHALRSKPLPPPRPGPIDVPLPCPLSRPDPDRGRVRRARHRRHALDRQRPRELHAARRGRLPAVPQGLPTDRAGRDPACAPLAVGPGAVELLSPPRLRARVSPRSAPDLDRPQARAADRLPRRALTLAIAHGTVTP